ncbi:protein transport protein SEC31-like [Oryzias latipes]|uniref:protein transport protein SEC31-like n=1 Tax=Oryzias latipes TaxID=8090 RepID=UPI000CE231B6|nr:protein transport protein SEC31-like [Oryzias latipes]
MESVRCFLRVSFLALLVSESCGFPAKGSKATDGGSTNSAGSYRTVERSHSAPFRSSFAGGVSQPVYSPMQDLNLVQFVPAAPSAGQGSVMPVEGYSVASLPVQTELPAAVFYNAPVSQPAVVSPQPGGAQAGMPETRWVVAPPTFSEQAEAMGPGEFLPPAPQPQPGPVLQSGETSNIVKEAELGNYQQQTEEFGYPAEPVQPGAAFTSVLVPGQGLGGFWGSPYPGFDYRLLYGLYPPGTYTTFSQNHEKGKDYYQSIHYLKEHVSEDQGPQQQQLQQKLYS